PRDRGFDEARAIEWLQEQGYDGDAIFVNPVEGEAKRACLEIWLRQSGHEIEAGAKSVEELEALAQDVYRETNVAPPIFGKTVLYDGRNGETFDQPITAGYIYMLK